MWHVRPGLPDRRGTHDRYRGEMTVLIVQVFDKPVDTACFSGG